MWRRIQQVLYYLFPGDDTRDLAFVSALLNPAQQALFQTLSRPDRAHAIRVARRMAAHGAPHFAQEAALLHDCGKPAHFTLWMRVAGVLADKSIHLTHHVQTHAWYKIYSEHGQDGIRLARQHGSSPEAVALLEAYLNPAAIGTVPWLDTLKQCDDLG